MTLTVGVALLLAGVAVAAVAGSYSGQTKQHRKITFSIRAGKVRGLDFTIKESCPGGYTLVEHDYGFPPMQIHPKGYMNARTAYFGGHYTADVPPTHGGYSIDVYGKISGRTVTGRIIDGGNSYQSGNYQYNCHEASTTFLARLR